MLPSIAAYMDPSWVIVRYDRNLELIAPKKVLGQSGGSTVLPGCPKSVELALPL